MLFSWLSRRLWTERRIPSARLPTTWRICSTARRICSTTKWLRSQQSAILGRSRSNSEEFQLWRCFDSCWLHSTRLFDLVGEFLSGSCHNRKLHVLNLILIFQIQLLVTMGFICLFVFHQGVKNYSHANPQLIFIPMIGTIVLMCAIACCESARRTSPTNLILLGAFTLCESIVVGFISSVYDTKIVLMAIAVTAAIVIGLTLFAFQTKYDVTSMGGALCIVLLIFTIGSIVVGLFFRTEFTHFLMACVGAVIFSMYIVYDTQVMNEIYYEHHSQLHCQRKQRLVTFLMNYEKKSRFLKIELYYVPRKLISDSIFSDHDGRHSQVLTQSRRICFRCIESLHGELNNKNIKSWRF